jgi:uncharacterized repeat protein (TIGR03803 family)
MKPWIKNLFILPALVIQLVLMLADRLSAQTFTTLYSFTEFSGPFINGDGANPTAGLILSGTTLHGAAFQGGTSGAGTVFAVNSDGSGFTNLHNFTSVSDGANPVASLILSDNVLFGTAQGGGSFGNGTVFRLSLLPPQLTLLGIDANVVLTWPTYAPGVTLQSSTNLVPPIIWTTVSPAPVVVNGQYTVTNPITGTQQFYRLSQ